MIRYYSVPKETFVTNGTIVEPLNVTENGTYAPPAGTAYSPVVVNVEGGETWNTVFEGSVTRPEGAVDTTITGLSSLTADTIKVTFDGTEYICENNNGEYGAPFDGSDYDWSEYPFSIYDDHGMKIATQTAGTYTLKIEEPQSGGESDFTTAEVTIINNTNDEMYISVAILQPNTDDSYGCVYLDVEEQATVTVILYKGNALTNIPFYGTATSTNGNYDDGVITGDDTITINPAQ